jgi:hypothetical protein
MAEELENDPQAGLSKPWKKFFDKFNEINSIKVSEWKDVHILAYICDKYNKKFNRKFSVTIKGAPSKSPDMYMIKRIGAMLNTTNKRVVKEYIDWAFENKLKKTPFRKVGFFLTQGFGNEFIEYRNKKKNEWDRSSEVPEVFKTIARELGITINTYGDLAFIKMAVDRNNDPTSNHYVLLGNLELIGLDLNRLKGLK